MSRIRFMVPLLGATALLCTSPVFAVVTSIQVSPPNPTACDSVTITVSGYLPDGCHHLTGATIHQDPEIPCMRPEPCPGTIHVEIAETLSGTICPQVITPYTFSFPIGRPLATDYSMDATDRVFLFDTQVGQTFVKGTFTATFDTTSTCVPGNPGCYILSFHDPRIDPPQGTFCDDTTVPGGTACLPVDLMNTVSMGGLQMTVPIPASGVDHGITVASAEAVGRASGFQVSWSNTTDGPKFILYSTTGETIPAGDGPVMRICFTMHAPPGSYEFHDEQTVVADTAGSAVLPCPTFARIAPGVLCVASVACDLNGDGTSDVLDVIHLVRCALASTGDPPSTCPDAVRALADCNGDGSVDVRDVICCVRKIVGQMRSPIPSPILPMPVPLEGSSIGFDGPIDWTNTSEGVARIRVNAAQDWGGVQFSIDATGAPVRITGMALDPGTAPSDATLESAVDKYGAAHGILFGTGPSPRNAATFTIAVSLVRTGSGIANRPRLVNLKAGTSSGAATLAWSFNPTLDLANPSVPAPALMKARPNPFTAQTEIAFVLPADARVTLNVYDVRGRLVRTLVNGTTPAGAHLVRWDGADALGHAARSGIYFTKLTVGAVSRTERIMLLR
jgi:hypothetical protein